MVRPKRQCDYTVSPQVELKGLTFELSPNVAVFSRVLLFIVVLELVE